MGNRKAPSHIRIRRLRKPWRVSLFRLKGSNRRRIYTTGTQRNGTIISSFRLYVLRNGWWLNWWNLWHESDTCREGFESRHDLSYAGNGFVFPRVIFEPMGDSVYLKVRPWDAEHAPIQFVSQYDARLDRQTLQEEFTSLIEAVIDRLDQKGVAHEFLKSEWQAINSLDAEEKEFCKAAAILGLDPLDIDPDEAARIAEVWNKSDPLTREEGILCADIESLDEMGAWIDGAVSRRQSRPKRQGMAGCTQCRAGSYPGRIAIAMG